MRSQLYNWDYTALDVSNMPHRHWVVHDIVSWLQIMVAGYTQIVSGELGILIVNVELDDDAVRTQRDGMMWYIWQLGQGEQDIFRNQVMQLVLDCRKHCLKQMMWRQFLDWSLEYLKML